MLKNLKAAFMVLILLGNLLAVFPQAGVETEGCDTECCTSSQTTMSEVGEHSIVDDASNATVTSNALCILECQPRSEAPPSFSILTGIAPAQQLRETIAMQAVPAIDYTSKVRFPDSPTASFNGSSHRFLECGCLLI